MAMYITWNKAERMIYIMAFLVIAILVQMLVVWMYYLTVPVDAVYVLVLVPLGVSLVIAGSMVLLTDFLYQYLYMRKQDRMLKAGDSGAVEVRFLLIVVVSVLVVLGLYSLFRLLFTFLIVDPIFMHGLPVYGQVALAETLSGFILIVLLWMVKELQIRK